MCLGLSVFLGNISKKKRPRSHPLSECDKVGLSSRASLHGKYFDDSGKQIAINCPFEGIALCGGIADIVLPNVA